MNIRLKAMGDRQEARGDGRWVKDIRLWAIGNRRWAIGDGQGCRKWPQHTIFLKLIAALIFTFLIFTRQAQADNSFRERLSTQKEMTYSSKDIEEEVDFGREIAARILGRVDLLDNKSLNKYVNLVGKSIAIHSNRPEIDFRFAVLNTKEINAYSAPGGYIFITRGALELMEDESELAGVLAHEIAHVTERHIVKEFNIQASDESPVSAFARFIGGGGDPAKAFFNQAVDKALDILFKDGYKRADEAESDKIAILLTTLAGYRNDGLLRYLKRISEIKGKGKDDVGKTHPIYEERFSLIEKEINDKGVPAEKGVVNKERLINILKSAKIK